MARQGSVAIENNFVKGLITEATALKFPPNACTETFDCAFDNTGRVTRRPGIDLEADYELLNVSFLEGEAYNEYSWNAVAGLGNKNFTVIQQGDTLRFYDNSDSTTLSPNVKSFTVTLSDHLPETSTRDPSIYPCDFAQGNGKLIVVNEACDPFYVQYDPVSDDIEAVTIVLQYRDFEGLDDGLGLTERPTATEAGIKSTNPEHYYNILNQGWHQAAGLAIQEWDTARTDLPSNADLIPLYRGSATDIFDNARVLANSPGNTPATKGHFILDVGNPDRTQAMVDGGFTGAAVDFITPLISPSSGTITSAGAVTNDTFAFDGVTNADSSSSATGGPGNSILLLKSWSSANRISQAIVYGSNDAGFVTGSNPTVSITLYGANVFPPFFNSGTVLGSVSFTDTADEHAGRTVISSDVTTPWLYTWVVITSVPTVVTFKVAEVEFYSLDTLITVERPSAVEFFAGRAWYGGIKTDELGSNIYFSQIIESNDQYAKCYQTNDPTAEDNAQLLPTDGGVIKIPEMGTLINLFATQNSLLVFATNGVWLISGSAGAGFSASDFIVSKLSTVGTNARHSFINIQGTPFWWAETDIYTAEYDPNYNSYKIVPITTNSITTFITDIPEFNRSFIKGAYNTNETTAFWIYNSSDSLTDNERYVYTNALVFDTLSGAFYPWTVGDSDPQIRGILSVTSGSALEPPKIKLYTTIPIDSDSEYITWSQCYQPTYTDWSSYADFSGDPTDEIDYSSYFITGYRLDGQAHRFFQSNYVIVYLDTQVDGSCYMQGIFDFTNSNASGKWSTLQQVYNSSLLNRDINHRKLKVRGKGKSLQLKFESETGKPFSIIGWVLWETSNATL